MFLRHLFGRRPMTKRGRQRHIRNAERQVIRENEEKFKDSDYKEKRFGTILDHYRDGRLRRDVAIDRCLELL